MSKKSESKKQREKNNIDLEKEIEISRAENDYLKKLYALVQEIIK